jgi:hypothetical protein
MTTTGRIVNLAVKHTAGLIAVDEIGIGAGIVDRLRELKLSQEISAINSAAKSSDPLKWKNLRAEMWSSASDKFAGGQVSIPQDERLSKQLKAVRYKTIESNGCLQVESKEELKKPKRLGESPDRADALIMGLWVTDSATSGGKDYISDYNNDTPERGRGGYG